MNMGKYLLPLLSTVVVLVSQLAHAATTVTATVDRNSLNPDDTLTLVISVESTEDVSVGQPSLPSLNDFELINQWTAEKAQSRIVVGPRGPTFETTRTNQFNYMLQPKRQGTLNIAAAEVVVDGKVFNTKPISVRVAPGAGMQARPRGGQQPGAGGAFPPPGFDDEEDDLFNQLLRRMPPGMGGNLPGGRGQPGESRQLPINPNEAFFVQADVDKTEAYVGEQVTVSFYLYTRGQIRDLDTLKYPSLKGFWKEDIEIATHLNFQNEVVNGLPYKKALLASFALFPIKEGVTTIDEYKAKCSVIPTLDAFGAFGLGKAYTFTKSSVPVKIKVKPLPLEGKPEDFSGAVGEYQVTSRVEDRNIVEGQPFTLRLRFEGRGNAKMIELPPFTPPEWLELYDTQNEARFYRTGTSYKEFQILLIPRREGEFTIPSMSVSMFDPSAKVYVKKETEPLVIRVGKGSASAAGSVAMPGIDGGKSQNAAPKDQTPRLITDYRASTRLSAAQTTLAWSGVFALIMMTLFWRARTELGWGQRKKDLMRQLKARLRRVEAKATAGDWRGVGAEMTNAVYFVLGEITGEGGANMEFEKLMMKAPPSVRRELAEPLSKQMETFQVLCFAPESVVGGLKDPQKLKEAISQMEKLMEKAVSLGLSSEQDGGSSSDPKAS